MKIPKKLYEKNTNGKILYVRHGITQYNQDRKTMDKKLLRIKEKYIDCPLNEDGINSAKNLQEFFNKLEIEQVYVSPLYRALQTAYFIFKNHPKKNEFDIKIHPLISEKSTSVHDFCRKIKESKKDFNEKSEVSFNWKIFDNYYDNELKQNTFFMNFMDNLSEEKKIEFINKFKKDDKNYKKIEVEISKFGSDFLLESFKHLFLRNLEFKNFLKKEHEKTLNDINKKIVVITHSAYSKLSTSLKAYNMEQINEYPDDCLKLNNCEVISMYI